MGFIAPLLGAFAVKKAIDTPKVETPTQQTAATPAAAVMAPDSKQETGVDSTGETLKRKARGKKGLMINAGSNTSGGGSTGGTGLNI